MGLSATAALWFLPFILPICLFVAFDDMRSMKIRNVVVLYVLAVFVIIGPIALPFDQYLRQLLHVPIVLVIGFILNAIRVMGAGDAKFITAASPYFVFETNVDVATVMVLFVAASLAGAITHRIAKHSPVRRLTPDWESWKQGKRYPMGMTLGPMFGAYLLIAAFA